MKYYRMGALFSGLALVWLIVPMESDAGDYRDLEKQVVEHTLPNGLKFLLVKRGEAPVFSFCTTVHAGAVDEQYGIGGIAHMMEHMAFKGSQTVGTTDYAGEAQAIERVDDAYEAILQERREGVFADSLTLARLEQDFREAQKAADTFVIPNEYSRILDEEGATGVNAYTGADQTVYYYSLPSNKIELWALMESDRMTYPVFREFYKENEVVQEERRMRFESTASGRLLDEFLSAAFKDHPYGHGIIGTPSDLKSFTRRDGRNFRNTYYVARNMTTAVVGDIDVKQTIQLAEKYFGDMPDRPLPPVVDTKEPPQMAQRRVIMEDAAQPFFVVGYHVPEEKHPDFPAIEAATDILANGRSSRLHRELVKKKLAVQVGGIVGPWGRQYNTIAIVFVVASAGTDIHELEEACHGVVSSLCSEAITPQELEGYKARAKADHLRRLRDDDGFANQLTYYEEFRGGWRNLFTHLDSIEALTIDDLLKVSEHVFTRNNRTVAMIVPPAEQE